MHSKMTVIRSSKHQLYTMEMNKVSLSAYDDMMMVSAVMSMGTIELNEVIIRLRL